MLTTVLGRRVLAERHGVAPGSVLALHGWRRTREDFAAVLAGLDGLALDLPGFGATAPPESAWSTAEYAEHLAPLLSQMDRPVLVGHSFGGRIAAHLAATQASLIRGVVFTGTPLVRPAAGGSRASLGYRVVRSLRTLGVISDARLEAARKRHGSADYRAADGVMRDVLVKAVGEDYSEQLCMMRAAGVPTRFVYGAGDTAAPVELARRAAELAGAPDVAVVEGSAHLLDAQLSAAVHAAIVELAGGAGSADGVAARLSA